jgi:hypothetical protein
MKTEVLLQSYEARTRHGGHPRAAIRPITGPLAELQLNPCNNGTLDFRDMGFVALIKRPLLDPLGPQESSLRQDFQVLADRGLAHSEFLGNKHAADTVGYEISVDLRPKMRLRALEPFQDQTPPVVRQRPQRNIHIAMRDRHIAN